MKNLNNFLKTDFNFVSHLLEVFPVRPGLMSPPRTKTSSWNSERVRGLASLQSQLGLLLVDFDSSEKQKIFGIPLRVNSLNSLFFFGFERDQLDSLLVLTLVLAFLLFGLSRLGFSTERVSSAPGLPGEPQGRRKRMRKVFKILFSFPISNPPFMKNVGLLGFSGQGLVTILGINLDKSITIVPAKPITLLNLSDSLRSFRVYAGRTPEVVFKIEKEV